MEMSTPKIRLSSTNETLPRKRRSEGGQFSAQCHLLQELHRKSGKMLRISTLFAEGGTPLLRAIANQAKRISTCLLLAADSRMASQMTALR